MSSDVILFPDFEKLKAEVDKLRTELSMLIYERDELVLVECKNLEMEYMLALGDLEYKAYELHCTVLRLKRKTELIQARKNRQEKIILSDIEAALDEEFADYQARLEEQLRQFGLLSYPAKFGGATGNMNAHKVAYPGIDWPAFADRFVTSLGLKRSCPTTQIEHYDNLAAIFDNMRRINTILIDMARDIWTYISMEYFRQKVNKNEVGSSAMPHKVNPIDFENAEGNLGMADAVLTFLSMKLPVSRLQRDLTDSTVLRNIGVPVAHGLIALNSLKKGLGKLILNESAIEADLERNWAVVAEGIQTILRRESYPNPYETLKALTRTGAGINHKTISDFIDGLDVSESVKEELRAITPMTYTGF